MDIEQLISQCQKALQSSALKQAHSIALKMIEHAPQYPDGYYYLSKVPLAANQTAKAIPILQKALSLYSNACSTTPSKLHLQATLMRCYGQTMQVKSALELIKAITIDSESILKKEGSGDSSLQSSRALEEPYCVDLDTIAVTLTRFEWHHLALPLFRMAVKVESFLKQPPASKANLLCNLAASCNYLGHTKEAIAYYQKAIEHEANNLKAQLALSRIAPSGTPQRILNLQTLLDNSPSDYQRLHFSNALFLEHEHLKDFERAATQLQTAYGQAKCSSAFKKTGFSQDALKQKIDAVRGLSQEFSQRLSQTSVQSLAHTSVQSTPPIPQVLSEDQESPLPVFVVGLPRSGTTLLDRILCQHPNITSLGERDDIEALLSPIIQQVLPVIPHSQILTSNVDQQATQSKTTDSTSVPLDQNMINQTLINQTMVDQLRKAIHQYHQMSKARLDGLKLQVNFNANQKHAPNFATNSQLESETSRETSQVILDQMPLNIWFAPLILALIPNAKIITIKKQRNDAVWSNYKYLFNPNDVRFSYSMNMRDISTYYDLYEDQVNWLKQHYSSRIKSIQYEQLVSEPEHYFSELMSFLNLEPMQNKSSVDEWLRHDNTGVSTASSQQVKGGLSNKYVGQWQNYTHLFDA